MATAADATTQRLARVAGALGLGTEQLLEHWETLLGPAGHATPTREITASEQKALAGAGIDLGGAGRRESFRRVVEETSDQLARLWRDSLTTGQVASLLGVSVGRVRQKAADQSIYGFHWGGGREWRFPAWQFVAGKPLPHLKRALDALPRDMSPVALDRLLTTAHPQLATPAGRALSPIEWLAAGQDPTIVCGLLETVWVGQ